jgi:hypothetical protein
MASWGCTHCYTLSLASFLLPDSWQHSGRPLLPARTVQQLPPLQIVPCLSHPSEDLVQTHQAGSCSCRVGIAALLRHQAARHCVEVLLVQLAPLLVRHRCHLSTNNNKQIFGREDLQISLLTARDKVNGVNIREGIRG